MRDSFLQRCLIDDALSIWRAGVDSVRGDQIVRDQLRLLDRQLLQVDHLEWDLSEFQRIVVMGAGKATAAMAEGLLQVLEPLVQQQRVVGWINVPEGSFDPHVHRAIHFHAARPVGINEPTHAGAWGTGKMLELAQTCSARDLVICLLSGGGSAMTPAPLHGVSLEDKLNITRMLSSQGASIEELNTVRRALSRFKAGGLARACGQAQILTLVLSDVLGDSLETISSGPTLLSPSPNRQAALRILHNRIGESHIPPSIRDALQPSAKFSREQDTSSSESRVVHVILGNNATAVDHAGQAAVRLGYSYWMQSSTKSEGDVIDVADRITNQLLLMRESAPPECLILGGEPTVVLPAAEKRGKGGRNQSLALRVLQQLLGKVDRDWFSSFAFVSAGTDGEDGPTDAAGAFIDLHVVQRMFSMGISPDSYLERHDAYTFFERVGGLLKTGPTHTNVCDLRIGIVGYPDKRDEGL